MTFLEIHGDITDVEYPAYIALTVPADCNFDYKMESAVINQAYDAAFCLKQRFNNRCLNPHERILRQRLGLDPWIYLLTSPKRKILCMVVKEFAGDRILYEDFRIALRNLHEYCDNYSVATLAMPRLGCDKTDGLEWDLVNAMLYEEFGQTNIRLLVCISTEPAPTPEDFYKPIILTSDIYPFPCPPRDPRVYHPADPMAYGEPLQPQNRTYIPIKPAHRPWPEFSISPDQPLIQQNPNEVTIPTNPEANCADIDRARVRMPVDQNAIPDELAQWSSSCHCGCECCDGKYEAMKPMNLPHDLINDPIAMHAYRVQSTSSHAYPIEDIMNPDVFYKPAKPVYEHPIVPNMPATTPTWPEIGTAEPQIILEPGFPEPETSTHYGWPESEPRPMPGNGVKIEYASDGRTCVPVKQACTGSELIALPDIDQEPIYPQNKCNMHGPGDPLALFERPGR